MNKTIGIIMAIIMVIAGLPITAYAGEEITIYNDSQITADLGAQIKIPVKIKNNTGILGYKLIFNYDAEVLTPVSVEYADIISGGLQDNIDGDSVAGEFCVYWAGTEPITQDGTMFYINMEVNSAYVGEFTETHIDVSYSQGDTFDDNFNDVVLNCERLRININYGDFSTSYSELVFADWSRGYRNPDPRNEFTISAGDTFDMFFIGWQNTGTATKVITYDPENFTFLGYGNGTVGYEWPLVEDIKVDDSGRIELRVDYDNETIFDVTNGIEAISLAFKFKANDNAFSGDYVFDYDKTEFTGVDAVRCEDCVITVNPTDTSETAQIYSSEDISASAGEIVTVPVSISNNHGLMGYRLGFSYDPALLEPVECVGKWQGTFSDSIGNTPGEFSVLWNNTEQTVNNGVLFELKFKVLSDEKTEAPISVSYSQEDTFNEVYRDVKFDCKNINLSLNPITEPDLTNFLIKTVSLSLESSITMNFKVLKTALADYENPYIVFKCADLEDLVVKEYIEQGDYYVFSYPGIAPQMMNDNVTAVLHATHKENKKEYTSPEKIMSVREYTYIMLDRYNSNTYAKLRTLLVDLLNYGAAAQTYQNYQTNNLVNNNLTEIQKSWGTNTDLSFTDIRNYNYKTIDNPTVSWTASGLVLNNSVMIRAKFTADSIENKTIKIICNGRTFTYTREDFTKNSDGSYYVYCDEIYANEMSREILLTVYDNGVQCSNTMRYSIESYASVVQNSAYAGTALDKLTQAMMRYGKSAEAYRA